MLSQMSPVSPPPGERRLAHRQEVENGSHLAQRSFLRVPGQKRQYKCRITNSSAIGYRAVILSPSPDAGRHFAVGQALTLEHSGGWARTVGLRWSQGNMLGLEILDPVTRLILTGEQGEKIVHDCQLLGTHGELYRVSLPEPPVLFGVFTLELPNGENLPVRVRWALADEICLQLAQPRYRL